MILYRVLAFAAAWFSLLANIARLRTACPAPASLPLVVGRHRQFGHRW
jgi:hypothetical protein